MYQYLVLLVQRFVTLDLVDTSSTFDLIFATNSFAGLSPDCPLILSADIDSMSKMILTYEIKTRS